MQGKVRALLVNGKDQWSPSCEHPPGAYQRRRRSAARAPSASCPGPASMLADAGASRRLPEAERTAKPVWRVGAAPRLTQRAVLAIAQARACASLPPDRAGARRGRGEEGMPRRRALRLEHEERRGATRGDDDDGDTVIIRLALWHLNDGFGCGPRRASSSCCGDTGAPRRFQNATIGTHCWNFGRSRGEPLAVRASRRARSRRLRRRRWSTALAALYLYGHPPEPDPNRPGPREPARPFT